MEEISPTEDLMREHGLVERILLIYEEIIRQIDTHQKISVNALKKSSEIVRSFIENYHEKSEENHLFPRFEKAKKLVELVRLLQRQHQEGRTLTDYISLHANDDDLIGPNQQKKMKETLQQFINMYRPHKSREDTILFPSFRALVSEKEYQSLEEIFEEEERSLFGEDGFSRTVSEVARIEKELGIYEVSLFTPNTQNDF